MHQKIFFISLLSTLIFTHSYTIKCLDHQKTLLLQLKNELIFSSSISTKLVQWNQRDDCCSWYGVECVGAGFVVSLQLDGESITGGIGDSSSTLFRIKYLQKLNLAYNDFKYIPIPRGIHNLTYLTHLNLSHASFGGQVPHEISSLIRLVRVDMSNSYRRRFAEPLRLEDPNLKTFLRNLTGLRELYLDRVNITSYDEKWNWSHIISSHLPHLTTLSLVDCFLSGPLASSFWQLRSLSFLRLDGNDLSSAVLDLFANFSSLVTLSLVGCNLNGTFPNEVFHIPTLQHLDLSINQDYLTGTIPPFTKIGPLMIKSIRLIETNFSVLNVSNLVGLDLSYNRLEGPIPDSLFRLQSLESLHLSDNLFSGSFQLDKTQSLHNLEVLYLSLNNLSVYVDNSSTYELPKLEYLGLASCNLNLFPDFIKHSDMVELDLSNNQIGGEIPSWIWGSQLVSLDLAHNLLTNFQKPYNVPGSLLSLLLNSNQLTGELDLPISPSLRHLLLSNNSFSGSIPTSLCSLTELIVLDLSSNKLSGHIPPCLFDNISVLCLGSNNISGCIPDNFPRDGTLQYFDVNNNILEGKVPESLKICKSLEVMNVGNNLINDTFPCIQSLELRALILHSNRFHGEVKCQSNWPKLQVVDISSNNFNGSLESINFSSWRGMVIGTNASVEYASDFYYLQGGFTLIMKGLQKELFKIWEDFGTIDFSCNHFQGEIPSSIRDLKSLHLLNLSHNALKGSIPKSLGNLGDLESLDLSKNRLAGHIPMELAKLTFLSFLNLSYNKLVGEIPNGRQLQTFLADSFLGNQGLCGFNLNISCNVHTGESNGENEDEEKTEIEWEYVSAALGYVVGLGGIAWLLLLCRRFRRVYFDKIDEVVEGILDARDTRIRRRKTRNRVVRRQ